MADHVVVRKSATKVAGIVAVCFGFILAGALFIAFPGLFDRDGHRPEILVVGLGWISVGFFGWMAWQRAQELWRPSTLEISSVGFRLSLPNRVVAVPWGAIEAVEVWRQGLWQSVAWKLVAAHANNAELRTNPVPPGFDGSIGNGWIDSPETILALMTERRQRHHAA